MVCKKIAKEKNIQNVFLFAKCLLLTQVRQFIHFTYRVKDIRIRNIKKGPSILPKLLKAHQKLNNKNPRHL